MEDRIFIDFVKNVATQKTNHPIYRKMEEAIKAAVLLKQHFFMENNYSSYKHKDHWIFFQFHAGGII
jgi:hypothetical protein